MSQYEMASEVVTISIYRSSK